MSENFISLNFKKIINDNKENTYPKNLGFATAWLMIHFKAYNLKILDISKISDLADYLILGTVDNPVQANSLAQEVITQGKRNNCPPLGKEGLDQLSDWVLIDFGDIIVHIFQPEARNLYNLDDLWVSANTISIPEEYYINSQSSPETPGSNSSDNDQDIDSYV